MAPPLRTFEIGPGNAVLTVRTTKAGLAAKMAHDLTLEATVWSGSLTFDEEDLAASSVEVSVVAASLTVVDSSGGVMPLSDGDRSQIARNINDKILRTKTYPDITFRSTTIEGHADTFTVTGDLTITGTTRPVSLTVTVTVGGGGGGQVTVEAVVAQTAFGVTPYSAMLGALKVSDEVTIHVTLSLRDS